VRWWSWYLWRRASAEGEEDGLGAEGEEDGLEQRVQGE
jgi:hypothetical protein